nr:hypothetical protein [Anaerohalosphaeraceae bacterium]HRT52286.1 hypothetical protein [Anaerohalosphaeraceae bacterium]HRT88279.1 hypothetical protein [Anaerohalosphaeraceae bacterium]
MLKPMGTAMIRRVVVFCAAVGVVLTAGVFATEEEVADPLGDRTGAVAEKEAAPQVQLEEADLVASLPEDTTPTFEIRE